MDKTGFDVGVYRIIDANINRVMEGIRVCEDIVRFASNNEILTRELKEVRHLVLGAVKPFRKKYLKELVSSRDSYADVGLKSIKSEKNRENIVDLFMANIQRGKESLRVLEEVMKLFHPDMSVKFKSFRFRLYELEKTAVKDLGKFRDVPEQKKARTKK